MKVSHFQLNVFQCCVSAPAMPHFVGADATLGRV